MKLLRRIPSGFWPIGILLFLEGILAFANYTPSTWLMGWDNVMPEFNFRQALATNIFGVWQEHRGLGLYDGMGHAANLIHTIFLWLLSIALPTSLLRYVFHFFIHFLGGIGAYVLLKKLVNDKTTTLTGALFYMFNLATIQMFYTPLEAFSIHFAALPWLAWSLLRYLKEGSRQRFLIFLLISLLSTPQFFIPTLLLPVAILLTSISVATRPAIKRVSIAACGFLLVNAFWLLPYVYGLPHNAPIIQAAKINQMSTGEVFARNQAFGDLGNVLRLRGFPLDFEDVAADGTTTYLMAPWGSFLAQPPAVIGSWLLVIITLLGAIFLGINLFAAARKKTPMDSAAGGFLLSFLVGLLFLANNTPGLQTFTTFLQAHIPFFAESYRFPFTKFILLFSLSSTVLFTIGITWISEYLPRIHKKVAVATSLVVATMIITLAIPAFRGNFFSDRLRVALPDDYPRVFAFMNDKPLGRVAYLPQHQYWSWKYYQWGYRGSGFSWYGLPQPLLERAFDPWSNENENYYWELSRSIYSKDTQSVLAVLAKYDVRYILLDEHIISPSHNRALYTEEIKTMLASLPEIKEVAQFDKLTVYERIGATQNFVSTKTDLPSVFPTYRWTDNDVAFTQLGNYIVRDNKQKTISNTDYIYPFRSLFTKRSISEREFSISDIPMDELVYDSTKSADLLAENVKPCGVLRDGTAGAVTTDQGLRLTSYNQRGCLSFSTENLSHRDGYLVAVESRHIAGRPLLFSLINDTARHVELETYLQPQRVRPFEATEYFILPPLANDGLGYTVYLSNDAIGRQESINDIKSIKFYRIPYQKLVHLQSPGGTLQPQGPALSVEKVEKVDHPNPAYYRIGLTTQDVGRTENQTLLLSQSFDPGWIALRKTDAFPYLTLLKNHVLVNNWSNGWSLPSNQVTNNELTIILFFLPQLLQWLGFLLLPVPFIVAWSFRK